MKLTLELVGWLMVIFTLLPFVRTTQWWIRILDFPRFQITIFIIGILALYGMYVPIQTPDQFVFLGGLIVALAIQARHIYPFTALAPKKALRNKESDPDNTFKLMMANVKMSNRNARKFIRIVREYNPDMLIVNEPDHWWAAQLQELDEAYPVSVKHPLENTYGMMLFSRLEFTKANVQFLVEDDIPSIHAIVKLRSGEEIELCCVHPQPPEIGKDTEDREAELLIVGKSVKKSSRASIVAGDLNDVGWSYTTRLFQRISGLLDPRIGRGFFNTYNAFIPFFRYPLDHVFYDPRFKLVRLERLPRYGSDHFPIMIELAYKPDEKHHQAVEHADQEDKQEAEELIDKGLEN